MNSASFFSILLFLLVSLTANAQVIQEWVQRYDGPVNGYDFARSVATDDSGNIYVSGSSEGSGTFNDYTTLKYSSTGKLQWAQHYDGPANELDIAVDMEVDRYSNVYVTGFSSGSGTFNDYATVKYNSSGVEQWVARYDGPNHDFDNAVALAVDTSGNVYVTGSSPGPNFLPQFTTVKYDSMGNEVWIERYRGPANAGDYPYAIAVDMSGNAYVTGASGDSTFSSDFATVKYNTAGVEQWVQRYNGTEGGVDEPHAVAVDSAGNVYVTGSSMSASFDFDYLTIKYDSAGVEQWVQRYDGPPGASTDNAIALALDDAGNVYVTGYSIGNGSGNDYLTIKYDPTGTVQWEARYNGSENDDEFANAIVVDELRNVYVTGRTGMFAAFDYVTVMYNSSGEEQWVQKYDGPANDYDESFSIAVDAAGNVYITGGSEGVGTSQDYATIKYSMPPPTLPAAPTLVVPADSSIIIEDSVAFVWTRSEPKVDRYWFELDIDSLFSDSFVDSSLTDTMTSATNLQNGQTYWWKVRAHNAAGWGLFSDVRLFSVRIFPDQVVLVSPPPDSVIPGGRVPLVWRRSQPDVDRYWLELALDSLFVNSSVDSTLVDTTKTEDQLLGNQTYWWKVRAHNSNGWGQFSPTWVFSTIVTSLDDNEQTPQHLTLRQNYPNPFNPTTVIKYGLPRRAHVKLELFNLLGQKVALLVDGEEEAGWHGVVLRGRLLGSGVYVYRLTMDGFVLTRKMLLIR